MHPNLLFSQYRNGLGATFALTCLVVSPITAEAQEKDQNRVTAVKFQTFKTHSTPIVELRFESGVVGRFFIDTGSETCLIREGLAKQLKLASFPPSKSVPDSLRLERKSYKVVEIKNASLGNAIIESTPAIVIPDKQMRGFTDEKIDGGLGVALFHVSPVLLNFEDHSMAFWEKSPVPKDYLDTWMRAGAMEVPIEPIHPNGSFAISATLNGTVKTKMLFDTGAARTTLTESIAKKLSLVSEATEQPVMTFGGPRASFAADLKSLALGTSETLNLQVAILPGKALSEHPLLGMNVLARYGMIIDLPARKLYLIAFSPQNVPVH